MQFFHHITIKSLCIIMTEFLIEVLVMRVYTYNFKYLENELLSENQLLKVH